MNLMFLILFLLNCNLFDDNDPPPDPDPYVSIKSKNDIIGEWVCYYTYLVWRLGSDKYYLDKFKEEDKLIIDSTRVTWRFLLDGQYYEYNFPYYLDTVQSLFCKDSIYNFIFYPKHHRSEPFGIVYESIGDLFRQSAQIFVNSTDIKFVYHPNTYDWEYSYYTKKTWQ